MLRMMRENTGSWIIKILLGIIVIAFVFIGMGSLGSKNKNAVATINDEPITINEYQEAYKRLVDQMRARFGDYLTEDTLKAFNVKQQALDQLIEERLIAAEAEKLDIKVADEEVQSSLLAVDAFKENGIFNIEKYKRVLGMNRMNPEIFEAQQFRSIRDQKVMDLLFDAVTVSDLEVQNWYTHQNTKVVVDYLKFDPKKYTDVTPEEADIETFYNENKENYKTEPKRVAHYLKFSPNNYKDKVTITKEQVETYYAEHQNELNVPEKIEARHILIKIPENADEKADEDARKQAMDIYEMAKAGQDFAELAIKYSQGPSAPKGGYLGSFERGAMVKPFEDAAFLLKAGEISQPVKTQFGWHVIKVENRFEAKIATLDEAYKEIETKLIDAETQNMAYSDAAAAFDAVIDGDSLEQAGLITTVKQDVQKTKAFTETGDGLVMEDSTKYASEAFKLPLETISDVQNIGTSYFLTSITEIIEPVVQPLEDIKERIAGDLTAKMKFEEAQRLSSEALSQVTDAVTLDQIAETKSLEIGTTKAFAMDDSDPAVGVSQEFTEAAFALFKKNQIHPKVIQTSKGFFIISLNERILPEADKSPESLEKTKNQIITAKQNQIYRTWMDELKKANTIHINTDFIN